MKKLILSLLLILLLILALAACENGGGNATHTHSYGAWKTTKAATCTNEGTKERVCSCGEKETETITALGHSFGEWSTTKQPTNTETGTQERVCKCGAKETETLRARWSLGLACYKNSSTQTCTITGMGTCTDQEVVIPESIDGYKVTSIGAAAFYNCTSITKVSIPEGVTEIGLDAFGQCYGIVSITIPTSVTVIGKDAFEVINSRPDVYITDLAAWCGILFESASSSIPSKKLHLNGTLVTDAVIPDGVTNICDYAFFCSNTNNINSISIPASVTSIGDSALHIQTIYFEGTKEQWDDINKHKFWYDLYGPATTIYCTDGILTVKW